MNKLFSILLSLFLYTSISLADDRIALMYNIIPDDDKNSVIDTKVQKKLSFRLYKNDGTVYYNNQAMVVNNNKFEIDISKLSGKQTFTFTNENNEEANFTYYLSDENGFIQKDNEKLYITTVEKTKIIYTAKEGKTANKVANLIKNMPENIKTNLDEITLLPEEHPQKAAGITNRNKITFYNLSSYNNYQFENIVYHEIAHTWAYDLAKAKKMDLTCKSFAKVAILDNNFVSNYSKAYITQANNYTEDFAESVAFYLMDTDNFTNKYPNRAQFINELF